MITIQDIHMMIKMELDKDVLSVLPSFTEDQIDYFVNKAYIMCVNQKFTGHNVLSQKFEESKKRISDLQGLLTNAVIPNDTNAFKFSSNEVIFNTSHLKNILYPINSVIEVELLNGEKKDMTTIEITHEQDNAFRETTENSPWIPNPVILYSKDNIVALLDRLLLNKIKPNCNIKLLYLKQPTRLQYWIYDNNGNKTINLKGDSSQIPEISEHVIQEIVSLTVDLMLDNIESQRIQTHPQLTQITE